MTDGLRGAVDGIGSRFLTNRHYAELMYHFLKMSQDEEFDQCNAGIMTTIFGIQICPNVIISDCWHRWTLRARLIQGRGLLRSYVRTLVLSTADSTLDTEPSSCRRKLVREYSPLLARGPWIHFLMRNILRSPGLFDDLRHSLADDIADDLTNAILVPSTIRTMSRMLKTRTKRLLNTMKMRSRILWMRQPVLRNWRRPSTPTAS